MFVLVLLWNVLVPLSVLWHTSVQRGRVRLTHRSMFSAGFLVYMIVPVLAALAGLPDTLPGRTVVEEVVATVPETAMLAYLVACAAAYGAFELGGWASRKSIRRRPRPRPLPFDRRLLLVPLAVLLAAAVPVLWALRHEFWTGYLLLSLSSPAARGALSGTLVALGSVWLLDSTWRLRRCQHWGWHWSPWRQFVRTPPGLATLVLALLALSLGTRMAVITLILSVGVWYTGVVQPLRLRRGLVLFGMTLLALGTVGLWRMGETWAFSALLAGLLAEPMLTSLSLWYVLAAGVCPLLRVPWMTLTGLPNLLPSVLVPTKAQGLLDPEMLGILLWSPFGAVHVAVTALAEVGLLGAIASCFLLGTALQALATRRHGPISQTMYALLSGHLAFTLWRDPLQQWLLKGLFEFSVLMPLLIGGVLHLMTPRLGPAARRALGDRHPAQ
jgi:hypothetical protein